MWSWLRSRPCQGLTTFPVAKSYFKWSLILIWISGSQLIPFDELFQYSGNFIKIISVGQVDLVTWYNTWNVNQNTETWLRKSNRFFFIEENFNKLQPNLIFDSRAQLVTDVILPDFQVVSLDELKSSPRPQDLLHRPIFCMEHTHEKLRYLTLSRLVLNERCNNG